MATIKEIKELLATVKNLDSPIFLELEKDSRSGVQKEISKRKKAIQLLVLMRSAEVLLLGL